MTSDSGFDLFLQGKVVLETNAGQAWYFLVGDEHVSIKKDDFDDNCCCEYGSVWRFAHPVTASGFYCKHVKACLYWLKERGVLTEHPGLQEWRVL